MVVLFSAGYADTAAAQNLFEALFGGFGGNARRTSAPAYADPARDPSALNIRRQPTAPRVAGGGGATYCVRLCDGRFFPLPRHAGATAGHLCSSFCPATRTQVFSGGAIDGAVAPDGTRYSELDNAFLYRKQLVTGCTCNGTDSLGLATVNISTDPTLREGDIVATRTGFVSYTSVARTRRGSAEPANFTPIDHARMTPDLRDKLANIQVSTQN